MSLKTIIELVALAAALVFGTTMAWIGIGFAEATPGALLLHAPLILAPLFGIFWVLCRHLKGRTAR